MTRRQEKRRAFLTSMMALIMCAAMLVGSTFSWFTDTTSNTGNRIETGELKVQLLRHDGTNYVDISDGEGDIFTVANQEDTKEWPLNGTLWEPGKTEVVLLQVKNAGTLALNYNIVLDIANDSDVALEKVLSYAIIPGMTAETYSALPENSRSWAAIKEMAGAEVGPVSVGKITAAPNGALDKEKSDCFALVVHMDENAGNEYQEQAITIDVNIVAKQKTAESDSFSNQYDKDASYPKKEVKVYLNEDFEGDVPKHKTNGWSIFNGSGTSFPIGEANGNKFMNMVKGDGNCNILYSPTDPSAQMVLEFDMLYNTAVEGSTSDGKISLNNKVPLAFVKADELKITFNNESIADFTGEKDWIHFAYVIDFDLDQFSGYVNGELKVTGTFAEDVVFENLRMQLNASGANLMIDNLKIYEGTEIVDLTE